jgi:hypothetical protein
MSHSGAFNKNINERDILNENDSSSSSKSALRQLLSLDTLGAGTRSQDRSVGGDQNGHAGSAASRHDDVASRSSLSLHRGGGGGGAGASSNTSSLSASIVSGKNRSANSSPSRMRNRSGAHTGAGVGAAGSAGANNLFSVTRIASASAVATGGVGGGGQNSTSYSDAQFNSSLNGTPYDLNFLRFKGNASGHYVKELLAATAGGTSPKAGTGTGSGAGVMEATSSSSGAGRKQQSTGKGLESHNSSNYSLASSAYSNVDKMYTAELTGPFPPPSGNSAQYYDEEYRQTYPNNRYCGSCLCVCVFVLSRLHSFYSLYCVLTF